MRSYKRRPPEGRYDVVLIGSGMGCLATASLLARAGQRVVVLERHWELGGFTHTFRRPGPDGQGGWEWDVGVHYVGQAERGILSEALALVSDGTLRFARIEGPYDRVVFGADAFDLLAPPEALVESLARRFPTRLRELRAHVRLLEQLERLSQAWVVDVAFPARYRRKTGAGRTRWLASRNLATFLRPRLPDAQLYAVLTGQWGDWGLSPRHSALQAFAAAAAHYLRGAYYPIGGSARFAESVAAAVEGAGGEIVCRAQVERILVERGRAAGVRMADGQEVRAKQVVSGVGVHGTAALLGSDARRGLGAALDLAPSHGHLALYLGLEGDAHELGLEATNTWLFPDTDHDASFDRFLEDPTSPFPSVFLSSPGAKDPTYASRFPGRATLEVVAPAPSSLFPAYTGTSWKRRGPRYEEEKRALEERLLEAALRHYPRLRGRVRHLELSTPLTTRDLGGAPGGSAYGLAHSPERFARPIRATTPIPGLFLTGQDLTTCGVASALVSGVLTASALLQRPLLAMPR